MTGEDPEYQRHARRAAAGHIILFGVALWAVAETMVAARLLGPCHMKGITVACALSFLCVYSVVLLGVLFDSEPDPYE